MAELIAISPGQDLLPVQVGEMALREVSTGEMWSLAPFKAKAAQLSELLEQQLELTFPEVNTSVVSGKARIIWFGRGTAFLVGGKPPTGAEELAAITDQSDGWAVVELKGPGGAEVLARLSPVDLRLAIFPVGSTARTELKHMMASITRTQEDVLQIMVFRSMIKTLVHDLKTAMEALMARG